MILQAGYTLSEGEPGLQLISFVAFVLIGVLGVRFALYAFLNRRVNELASQATLWTYLFFVGVVAALYGVVGVVLVVTSVVPDVRGGLILALLLLLAVTMREIYENSSFPSSEGEESTHTVRQGLEAAFLALAVVAFGGSLLGRSDAVLGIEAAGGVLFAGYGYLFGRRQLAEVNVQGTMLDTVLRHLLPVLAFGALIPAMNVFAFFDVGRAVILYLQVVFVIMTATTLMTATIKLRQNLAGLR
jgi:hypothetical protein